jgi:putative intracellular protease/amidase
MKVLIVCTSQAEDPINREPTGIWLPDLIHFYDELQKKRIRIDITSPLGGEIPIDEKSIDLKDPVIKSYYENEGFTSFYKNSKSLSDIDPLEYRLVYLVGGYGALFDFPNQPLIQDIIRIVYERNGTVISVGHGAAALLYVHLSSGELLIKDKYLTASSAMEDRLHRLTKDLPFYLEEKLKEQGAHYTKALLPFVEYIEMDERLITGQNPASSRKVASKALEELYEK